MSVSETLENLRTTLPGCETVAFGDLESRLVLLASQARNQPRERLDEICYQAAEAFEAGRVVSQALGGNAEPKQAMLLTGPDIRAFRREENDVVCVVCNDLQDSTRLDEALAKTLGDIR